MTTLRIVLLAAAAVLAIADLNLWMINQLDRSIDRQVEARRIVMQDQRNAVTYHCYVAKRNIHKERK